MAVQTGPADQPHNAAVETSNSDLIDTERGILDRLRAKLNEVNANITERNGGREEYEKERDRIRAEIRELAAVITKADEERVRLASRDNSTTDPHRFSRARVDNFQKSAMYKTTEAIDTRLADIDYIIMTTAMSSKEEKVLKQEATKLRKLRPEVDEMERLEKHLQEEAANAAAEQRATSAATADRRNALREELRMLRDKRDALRANLQMLEERRAVVLGPLRDLYDHRDALKREIAEHSIKLDALTREQQDREIAQRAEQARKRQARIDIERFERQIKNLEQDKQNLRKAIASSVSQDTSWANTTASQMRSYLLREIQNYEKAMEKYNGATTPETCADSSAAHDSESPKVLQVNDQTYVVRRKQVDNVAKPATKRKQKHSRASLPSEFMNHSMESIKDLKALSVSVPATVEAARQTVEELSRIVEAERERLAAADAHKVRKQQELEERLQLVLAREKELLAKAPAGWKPSSMATSAVA